MQEDSTNNDVSPAIRHMQASHGEEELWCDAESWVPSDVLENLPGVNPKKKAIWNVMGSLASRATQGWQEGQEWGGKEDWRKGKLTLLKGLHRVGWVKGLHMLSVAITT